MSLKPNEKVFQGWTNQLLQMPLLVTQKMSTERQECRVKITVGLAGRMGLRQDRKRAFGKLYYEREQKCGTGTHMEGGQGRGRHI